MFKSALNPQAGLARPAPQGLAGRARCAQADYRQAGQSVRDNHGIRFKQLIVGVCIAVGGAAAFLPPWGAAHGARLRRSLVFSRAMPEGSRLEVDGLIKELAN